LFEKGNTRRAKKATALFERRVTAGECIVICGGVKGLARPLEERRADDGTLDAAADRCSLGQGPVAVT
jgi:hypothetical protein